MVPRPLTSWWLDGDDIGSQLSQEEAGEVPSVVGEIEDLIVQPVREIPRWGYSGIHGELCNL